MTVKQLIGSWMMDRANLEPWAASELIDVLDAAGYVIVPKEATDDMLLAPGKPYGGKLDLYIGLEVRRQAWRRMLEAALSEVGTLRKQEG